MRGCLGLEILAGLDQDQWAFIQHDHGWALAWDVHGLGFGSDGRLHGCDAFGVGIDPLQTALLCHGLHVGHRQAERLHAWHAGACGGSLRGGRCFFTCGLLHGCVAFMALMTFRAFATRLAGLAWFTCFACLAYVGLCGSLMRGVGLFGLLGVFSGAFFTWGAVATFAAVAAVAVA